MNWFFCLTLCSNKWSLGIHTTCLFLKCRICCKLEFFLRPLYVSKQGMGPSVQKCHTGYEARWLCQFSSASEVFTIGHLGVKAPQVSSSLSKIRQLLLSGIRAALMDSETELTKWTVCPWVLKEKDAQRSRPPTSNKHSFFKWNSCSLGTLLRTQLLITRSRNSPAVVNSGVALSERRNASPGWTTDLCDVARAFSIPSLHSPVTEGEFHRAIAKHGRGKAVLSSPGYLHLHWAFTKGLTLGAQKWRKHVPCHQQAHRVTLWIPTLFFVFKDNVVFSLREPAFQKNHSNNGLR